VVARSNQKDGVPAKCFECGRKYKVPAGGAGPPQKQPGKKQALQDNPEVKKELMAVRKELAALKASVATSTKPDESSLGEQGAEPVLQAELKAARTEISALRELDETLHGLIQGGYEAALAAAEAKRDTILARQRGGLPLKAQLSKAQAFVEFTSKRLEAEQKKADKLADQQAELAEKIEQQKGATAQMVAKLTSAKAELAAISAKVSAENGLPDAADEPLQSSGVTQQAVADLCTFASNPGVQMALVGAGMPKDQQARVVAALAAVSGCLPATCAAPGAPAATAAATRTAHDDAEPQEEDMQLDDDLLQEMAEAAIAPGEPGDGNAASDRKVKVAEAKARITSLAKVKKMGKKSA